MTPENLQRDMALDQLVDDELPESERRQVLQALDAQPIGWRDLALRFLSRQTERTAVRQFIGKASPAEAPPAAYRPSFRLAYSRQAAALMLVGLLSAVVGAYMGGGLFSGSDTSTRLLADKGTKPELITASLPGNLLGTPADSVQVQVPVVASKVMPTNFVHPGDEATDRKLVIVPHGPDQAVVIPVVTIGRAEVIY